MKLEEIDLESGLLALIEYLTKVRLSKKSEKEKRDKEFFEREKRKMESLTPIEEGRIESENKMYEQFCKATEQLFQIIDTTLLKCYLQVCVTGPLSDLKLSANHLFLFRNDNNDLYLFPFQTNDAFVAPLIRLNHCHLGEAEKMLKKHEKNSELIILYQTKGLHKKALELLQKQSTQQDPSMQGPHRTVLYLQNLGGLVGHMVYY